MTEWAVKKGQVQRDGLTASAKDIVAELKTQVGGDHYKDMLIDLLLELKYAKEPCPCPGCTNVEEPPP